MASKKERSFFMQAHDISKLIEETLNFLICQYAASVDMLACQIKALKFDDSTASPLISKKLSPLQKKMVVAIQLSERIPQARRYAEAGVLDPAYLLIIDFMKWHDESPLKLAAASPSGLLVFRAIRNFLEEFEEYQKLTSELPQDPAEVVH